MKLTRLERTFSSPKFSNECDESSTVNKLLLRISAEDFGLAVIATTNHPASLDSSVTRPGYFDTHLTQMIQVHLKLIKLHKLLMLIPTKYALLNLEQLILYTQGYTHDTRLNLNLVSKNMTR